jgi:hypothetical protein
MSEGGLRSVDSFMREYSTKYTYCQYLSVLYIVITRTQGSAGTEKWNRNRELGMLAVRKGCGKGGRPNGDGQENPRGIARKDLKKGL